MGLVVWIAVVLTFLCTIEGRTYYVTPSENGIIDCGNYSSPCDTINRALFNAHNGDSISLFPGIYSREGDFDMEIKKSIDIQGDDGVIIDMTNGTFAFRTTSVSVTFRKIQFMSSNSSALVFSNATAMISDCQFLYCNGINGSSIKIENSNVNIENTLFVNGSAQLGGAILMTNSVVSLKGVNCSNNFALEAGSLYGSESYLNISECIFDHNRADVAGDGAPNIYLTGEHSKTYASDSLFFLNYGGSGAVARFDNGANAYFERCVMRDNAAIGSGGALYIYQPSYISLYQCNISSNSAIASGGAIYTFLNVIVNITDCNFSDNEANNGGAIYTGSNCNIRMDSVTFYGNSADSGGAIFTQFRCALKLISSTMTSNTGNVNGGGISCSDSHLDILSSKIEDNPGGDLFCSNVPSYTYCTVEGDSQWSSQCGESQEQQNAFQSYKVEISIVISLLVFSGIITLVTVLYARYKKKKQISAVSEPLLSEDTD